MDQYVLGAPSGRRRPDSVPTRAHVARVRKRASYWVKVGRGKLASDREGSVTCHMGTQFCFRVYVSVTLVKRESGKKSPHLLPQTLALAAATSCTAARSQPPRSSSAALFALRSSHPVSSVVAVCARQLRRSADHSASRKRAVAFHMSRTTTLRQLSPLSSAVRGTWSRLPCSSSIVTVFFVGLLRQQIVSRCNLSRPDSSRPIRPSRMCKLSLQSPVSFS
ncbi:hypothetical protein E6C27_scaffold1337G00170 [Cucumis melo var. makuwa]|uniref:Uncharacterized protein n=1 Tax=Cucumis melo var. makuwa TaxID=1194695 RepID=A0A5A7VBX9_CUCMM|nr:hypothetical protein E6C27_scaffold1337G00170 [Cucumis melo var. makuwa]